MTIQPLLTPDPGPDGETGIYVQKMLELISSARETLYIQLQYIHPSDKPEDAGFASLIKAVADQMSAGVVDVRIILSQYQSTQWMELLRSVGIDTDRVHIQNGVHNKGFVVDHHTVVVSSQNWSGDGVLRNRDAGLIIQNAQVAQYFEQVFEQDWDHVAVSKGLQAALGVAVSAEGAGMVPYLQAPRVLIATHAPTSLKVSPLVEEELRAREVTQAIVILERDTVAAASTSFSSQAKLLESHFVLDERSWSASLARVRSRASASLAWNRRSKVRTFQNIGVVLGDIHADGLAALRSHPAVRYVASSVSLSLIRPVHAVDTALEATTTWGIDTLGLSDLWAAGWTGKGISVGHIDTGVDKSHPALQDAVAQFLMTDDEGFPVPNAPARDTDRHGTHTAGTIAGRPVNGRRVGVAPDAMLYSAAVIEGGNTVARILAGLDWAAGNSVKVVSMSLGVRGYRNDFYEIMRTLRDRGILPVVAVGNEGPGTSRSPGNYDVVLSIGACDQNRAVADFSSSESFSQPIPRQVPDLIAPGVGVISAKVGGGFLSMDGTSMATPHIAGLAAVLWEARQNATLDQIRDAIVQSCVLPAADTAERAGRGVPNGPRAYELLTGQSLEVLPTHKVTVPVSTDVRRRVTKSVKHSLQRSKKPAAKGGSRNGRHRPSR
jgi:subtilisin family serine protease